ncbi:MAG TPA: chromate efflux transporter [Flavipsychrobacter sp.]|nr:chromate efflux transporter [Flavipsychrobacter sp.]
MGKGNLKEIAKLFFKLGCISFGGPAAHIAMMEKEIVAKQQWMDHDHFLDLVGATNLIPGPNSTEMTMHCGYEQKGLKGLIVAGACFIFPAVVITAAFAWAYQQYGKLPGVTAFIYGIKPAVIAIIISALITLGKKALKSTTLWILGLATITACLLGMNEIAALFLCGFAGMVIYSLKSRSGNNINSFFPLLLLKANVVIKAPAIKIFLSFLKIGALLYGGGYVLFAFLDAELVRKGLLSRQQLIDAIAVGQFTPGPVLSTATFIGWQMGGWSGALLATLGIFLPSFVLVGFLNPWVPKLRKIKILSAFLDAINAASVAVIAAVCVHMSRDAITDWKTSIIALLSLIVLLVFKKVNSAFIVIGGAAAGYLLTFL